LRATWVQILSVPLTSSATLYLSLGLISPAVKQEY
jgi:hypothetical protein